MRRGALGNAVHAFLEVAAQRLAAGAEAKELLAEVAGWKERVAAVLRGDGLRPADGGGRCATGDGALGTTLRDADGAVAAGGESGCAQRVCADDVGRRAGSGCGWIGCFERGRRRVRRAMGFCGSWITRPDRTGAGQLEDVSRGRSERSMPAQMEGYARALRGGGGAGRVVVSDAGAAGVVGGLRRGGVTRAAKQIHRFAKDGNLGAHRASPL